MGSTKHIRFRRWLRLPVILTMLLPNQLMATGVLAAPGTTTPTTPEVTDSVFENDPYTKYQCTWWAWSQRPDLPWFKGDSGNAKNWATSASAAGFLVDGKPQVGDVVVIPPGTDGALGDGHVAYVTAVDADNSVHITEYNGPIPLGYSGYRVLKPNPLLQFIHRKNAPLPPKLITPTQAKSFASASRVSFAWSKTGTDYLIELSPVTAGQGVTQSGWLNDTHWESKELAAPGEYSWRARARNSVGMSAWSSSQTFSIEVASPVATPADGWTWTSGSFFSLAPIDWKFTLTNVDRDAKVLVDGNTVVDTRTECGSVGSVSLSWGSHTYLIGHPQGTSAPKLSYGPTLVAVACAAGPITSATSTAVPTPTPPATPTPSPTATPTPVPTPQPSGTWIEPADSTEVLGATVHFAAHAYPVHAGDPSIDHVNFTVWWSTMGPKSGSWKTACTATRPVSGDLFQCDADLSTLDPEPDWNTAELLVSFDVYDVRKNHTLAPDGEHVLRWGPTVADDYEIRKYYPLAQFLPYNSDDFDVGYYTDKLTLPVTIKTPDVARAKQEVRDWIQSHGVDPSTHQLIWTTPAATQPSGPIAFVGTGCSPSPLPSALQSNRFSGAGETCYNFIFSGFGGAWPLIALDVIQPDGIYTQGNPAGVITGNGVTGYVPDQFGFILFFSSATSYPNGSWKIHVEDRAGHDVDAAFTYPAN